MVTTLIARRSQFHQEVLGDYVRAGSSNLQNLTNGLAGRIANSGLSAPDAQKQAYARIYQLVQAQAASLAYVDTFMVLAVASAVMFFLAFALKKNAPGGGAHVAVE